MALWLLLSVVAGSVVYVRGRQADKASPDVYGVYVMFFVFLALPQNLWAVLAVLAGRRLDFLRHGSGLARTADPGQDGSVHLFHRLAHCRAPFAHCGRWGSVLTVQETRSPSATVSGQMPGTARGPIAMELSLSGL